MCTVTFIPHKDSFCITSNRDEKSSRKRAIAPVVQKTKEHSLIFPRDADAGGTWIMMKENGDAAVLLNGAFLPHIPTPPYRKSRGLILLDVMEYERPSFHLVRMDLAGIEPFTTILLENNSLYEFRWDGEERYCKQLPVHRPYIWSSATLYDGLVVKKREQWFAAFLNNHPNATQQDIIHFHRFTGDGDAGNDLLMSRGGLYSTVSITSVLLTADRGSMKYIDIKNDRVTEKKIELSTTIEPV